ncbi:MULTISPECIES: SPOR domain-containing protein [unclassified Novosphingobium]|uniref:SPOR domain-containing protein n=1 Tax=unclassified Novosphingobium TaxID=2644732 RepID=UPI000D49F1B1|nr:MULTISPECIES: SPOR domain-containing protein [unclassified Novosphingobium]PTR11899.1 rare lipoprotein A [Novosphingobium sp. GV055]PUB04939.1 rare lipoprotein A [Novosphingobium sp. GV061]PUB21258.1 rare lipoprotein A [Novosphingobium sp. GV079]PUB42984.1 rare lipoprotein A [Novosphingobium sp. GV027]
MKSAADRLRLTAAALAIPLMLGCGTAQMALAQAVSGPAADYPMVLGAPFAVGGVTYTPADTMNYDAVGYAVPDAEGGGGISGAHRTLPLPSYVEVTSLDTGRTILVRLERRGPMEGDGLVALSPGAIAQLGLSGAHSPVRVRRVNPPEAERALLRAGQQAPARMDTPPGLLTALKRKLGILPPAEPKPELLAAALAGKQPPAPVPTPTPPAPAPKPVVRNTTPMPALRPPAPSAPSAAPKAVAAKAPVPKPVTPRPEPKAPAKAEPKPAPKAEHQATASAHSTAYVVQVGAFSTRANAEKAAREVGGTVASAGKFFRVRIAAGSQDDAKAALGKAKRAGYADAQIQRAP